MKVAAVAMMALLALPFAPAASADPPPPGCERVPILGLDPQVRTICDQPLRADGSWIRARQFFRPRSERSSCGGQYYSGGCPAWAHDVYPASDGPVETYVVTPETIPAGEPGHLDS